MKASLFARAIFFCNVRLSVQALTRSRHGSRRAGSLYMPRSPFFQRLSGERSRTIRAKVTTFRESRSANGTGQTSCKGGCAWNPLCRKRTVGTQSVCTGPTGVSWKIDRLLDAVRLRRRQKNVWILCLCHEPCAIGDASRLEEDRKHKNRGQKMKSIANRNTI